jgi:5-methylcytosine-specific restriction endonuclease McrA
MIGKRGKSYLKARRDAINAYCEKWGYKENDTLHGPCQSCGRFLAATFLDFSHKIPAGRDSKGNTPQNGTAMCRKCHSWLETSRDQNLAREALIESPSNLANGWMIQWPLGLNISLSKWVTR